MERQTSATHQSDKQIVAKSKAIYRNFEILETENGCTFFLGRKQYDCKDLAEAKAGIDAIYSMILHPQ